MRIKKLLLLLFLSLSVSSLDAQTSFSFPLSGTFKVIQLEGQPINLYNKLIIEGNSFKILKDDLVLKFFKIIEKSDNSYKVEQYFPENDDPKRDRERFVVKIISTNETESFISVQKPLRTELINLVKL